ncbi:MAG: toll/interleukin-1 receptor domain-containing protein [bacterium]|nr:toll/interleukin-1 receptor domain-containing protein [bacterium]
MARRIFVTYSHADQETLHRFLRFLDLPNDELLSVWSDVELTASEDWHSEIQQALDRADIAVALVSQAFLTSDYVRNTELPAILAACEQGAMKLACLFVGASMVEKCPIAFVDGNGARKKELLTRYQGLNDPAAPVDALPEFEQDRVFRDAAIEVRTLAGRTKTRSTARALHGTRLELFVQLQQKRDELERVYKAQGSLLNETRGPWETGRVVLKAKRWGDQADAKMGSALGDALFGNDTALPSSVMRALLDVHGQESGSGVEPGPHRYPVRARIQTSSDALACLPWARARWNGSLLADSGWTFEVVPWDKGSLPTLQPLQWTSPSPVLVIAPDAPPEMNPHLGIEELLGRCLENERILVDVATSVADAWGAIRSRRPALVYICATVRHNKKSSEPELQLGREQLNIEELLGAAERTPPVVLLTTVGDSLRSGRPFLTAVAGGVRLLVAQPTRVGNERRAHDAALHWLHSLFLENNANDPIGALQHTATQETVVFSGTSRFDISARTIPARDRLGGLLLDRRIQRQNVRGEMDDLLRDRDRRATCLIAYGGDGNLLDRFGEQVLHHLRRYAREAAAVTRMRPELLPGRAAVTPADIEQHLLEQYSLSDPAEICKRFLGSTARGTPIPVSLLDWGVLPPGDDLNVQEQTLRSWIAFCQDRIARPCPGNARFLCLLCVRAEPSEHEALEEAFDSLREDLHDRILGITPIPKLDHVGAADLREFLAGRDCSCPESLVKDITKRVLNKTGGAFAETVRLLDDARATSWHSLRDKL